LGTTIICKCTKCSGLILVAQDQKTKTCPYCNTKVNLLKAQKIAAASTTLEASEKLKILKARKGFSK
jgi:DNA-directed RNA polymerase subunit RPC12/RpoP